MRAAVLRQYAEPPELCDFDEPQAESGRPLEVMVAGLNPVDLLLASGSYHSGVPPVPYVVGREGVARDGDGRSVYFDAPLHPFGSVAERVVIDPASAVPLPEGLDPALAVCFGIAGVAAWLGLEWRGQLQPGETVLVLGASGVVGQVAVQAARLLGAQRVVAAARSSEGLARATQLGADATVQIGAVDDLPAALREATDGGADLVLDPVWGEPAAAAIQACNPHGRLVHMGRSAGELSSIPSGPLRGGNLSILGMTTARAPADVRQAAYRRMVEHAAAGEMTAEVQRFPLDQVDEAWRLQAQSPGHKLAIVL